MIQIAAVFNKSYFPLDVRTKFFLLFFIGFYIFTVPAFAMEIIIFTTLSVILTLNGQLRTVLKMGCIFVIMALLDVTVSPMISGSLSFLFNTVVRLTRLVFPIYLSAILLMRTTTVSEFIAAFRRMHLPDVIIIPISVMFRFIPTVSEEWQSIRNAMRFRGIGISAKAVVMHPMATLEYMLIPLLMSTATISDELAAASLSRGLDSGAPRTCITKVHLGFPDFIVLICCVGLVIFELMR